MAADWVFFRYAAQNALVLEEARTALTTGKIRTPSIPSPQTSEGGDGYEEVEEWSTTAPSSDPVSSGEQYEKSSTECNTPAKSSSSQEDEEDNTGSTDIIRASGESCDEESFTTSVTTTSENNSVTIHDESSSIPDTSCTDQTRDVCLLNLLGISMSMHVYTLGLVRLFMLLHLPRMPRSCELYRRLVHLRYWYP